MRVSQKSNVVYFYLAGAILFGLLTIIGPIIYSRLNSDDFYNSDNPPAISMGSIILSDNMNFESAIPRLITESTKLDEIGISYDSIKLDEILQSEGQYIDLEHTYLAYSFYIKNIGPGTVTVAYHMRITEVYDGMNEYVRILIIEDDDAYRMYQKADQPDEDNNLPQYNRLPLGIDFDGETIIFRNTFSDFKPDQVKCFRVIIWLEEQDPDINDNKQIGRMRTELNFSIIADDRVSSNEIYLLSSEDKNVWIPLYTLCNVNFEIYYEDEDIS